jgi:hypothetical protein
MTPSEPYTAGASDVPVAGTPGGAVKHQGAPENVPAETRELQADIEQTREDLGVKARTEEIADQLKANAQETTERIKVGAQEVLAAAKIKAAKAKQTVQDPQNGRKVKGGAAAVGSTALAMVVWVVRRSRNRPKTRGGKVAYAAGRTWERAVGFGEAGLTPEATSRRKSGAVVVLGTIAGLGVAYRVLGPDSDEPTS